MKQQRHSFPCAPNKKELSKLEQELSTYSHALERFRQKASKNYIDIYCQRIHNLLGLSENPCLLVGRAYDEEKMLPLHQQANDLSALFYVNLNRGILCYLFQDYDRASESLARAQNYLGEAITRSLIPLFYFYQSLVLLTAIASQPDTDRQNMLKQIAENQAKLENWVTYEPVNYLHKWYLVEAEQNRILNQKIEAIELYDIAIAEAKQNNYVQEEALANELVAKFYLDWGLETIAQIYIRETYSCYTKWGAKAKVKDLEQRYPQFLTQPSSTSGISISSTSSIREISSFLDLNSILKVSQALSREIKLDTLLTKMMQIIMENAGADQGYLILDKAGQWVLAAQGKITAQEVAFIPFISLETLPEDTLPQSIINYVTHTKKAIVLNDVTEANNLNTDVYFQIYQPQSVLCTPILSQGKVIGLLYLENKVTAEVFTEDRLEILNLLTVQAAISLENALLYDNLEQANQQLEDYSHTLEIKVEERTIKLQQAKKMADAANQAKSEFLSHMSHELRTPLNGILGYAQILQREKNLSPQQSEGLTIIRESGNHLLTLINDILDLAKIEARQLELYVTELQLSTFLESVVGILQMRATQKDILFQYQPNPNLSIVIQADAKRLRQVLLNLLGNGIKFTDQGSVTLKVDYVEDFDQQIKVEKEEKPLTVKIRFQIEDTGIGMNAQQLEKIFQPFEQVGDASRKMAGTGLGLAISQRLVELMGGQLQVKSQQGKGSIFWFEVLFPVLETAISAKNPTSTQIIGYQGKKRKILVVDDNRYNRLVLQNILEPMGFEVIIGEDGQEEVNLALEVKPDLIVSDLVMPVKNGLEAAQEIRQIPAIKDIPIIAISARVSQSDRHQSKLAGCNDFLPKPIQAEQLLEKLQKHLQLEWIYESISQPERKTEEDLIIPPPREQIEELHNLVKKGRIPQIIAILQDLKLENKFVPFAQHLIKLANEFELDKINQFLVQYLP